jgi:DNA-binding response OmpR family regulator
MRYERGTGPYIMVVEPDDAAATKLAALLEDDGYQVTRARGGREAYDLAHARAPELIVLDLVLPHVDGLTLYVDLKLLTGAPVIVCSATKRRRDRPLGFKLGVDDFVPKPFDWEDLEGRIEAALRRGPGRLPGSPAADRIGTDGPAPPSPRTLGDARGLGGGFSPLPDDHARHRTLVGGRSLSLTPTEHRLLAALLSRPDEFVRREELAQSVWGYEDTGIAQAISVHMHRLRSKLAGSEWRGTAAPEIRSVRGRGYAFCRGPAEPSAEDQRVPRRSAEGA